MRIAYMFAIAVAAVVCGAAATTTTTIFPRLTFQKSLSAGTKDAAGNMIFGTEFMHLVPHQGRLYAGNSLWTEKDPQIPKACQILVLDSPDGSWKVDHQFTRQSLRLGALRSFTLTTDGSGKAIEPTPILLAGPDAGIGSTVQIFSRDDKAGTWTPMNLGKATRRATTRAIGLHHDQKTGVDYVFVGNDLLGIFRGVYDPAVPGRIRWERTVELNMPPDERVMGFCDCNGVFYCATTRHIFMRNDGPAPTWKQIYSRPEEIFPVGIRGLTAVPNPSGSGEVLLFAALNKIRRIDPSANFQETIELNMHSFLTDFLGLKVPFLIVAYNEFFPFVIPGTKETVWLAGFENTYDREAMASSSSPKPRTFHIEPNRTPTKREAFYAAEARYVVRHASQGKIHYEIHEVIDSSQPTLVSVRSIAVSPFAADKGRTLYFSGFDCNYQPSHNTGWIYRGQLPHE